MAQSSWASAAANNLESFSCLDGNKPHIRYGFSNGEGEFWQEDCLRPIDEPVPGNARTVSPVYLLDGEFEQQADSKSGNKAKQIQDQCESSDSVWNFLHLGMDGMGFWNESIQRTKIKEFINGELPVSSDDCVWYKESSGDIVAIPPLLVSEERREILRRRMEEKYQLRSTPLYRKSQNKLHEVYSMPESDEKIFSPSSSVLSFDDILRNRCVEVDGEFSIALWGVGPEIAMVTDEFDEKMRTTVRVGQGNMNKYREVDVFGDIDMSIGVSEIDSPEKDLPEGLKVERERNGKITNVHEVITNSRDYIEEEVDDLSALDSEEKDSLLNISFSAYQWGEELLEATENGDPVAKEQWEAIGDGKALTTAYKDYSKQVDSEEEQEEEQKDVQIKPAERDSSGRILDGYSAIERGLRWEDEISQIEGVECREPLDEVVGEHLGISQRTYFRGRMLFEYAEEGDEAAIVQKKALKNGEKPISTAYRDWKDELEKDTTESMGEEQESESESLDLQSSDYLVKLDGEDEESPNTIEQLPEEMEESEPLDVEGNDEKTGIVDRILSVFGLQRV